MAARALVRRAFELAGEPQLMCLTRPNLDSIVRGALNEEEIPPHLRANVYFMLGDLAKGYLETRGICLPIATPAILQALGAQYADDAPSRTAKSRAHGPRRSYDPYPWLQRRYGDAALLDFYPGIVKALIDGVERVAAKEPGAPA